MTIAFGCFVVFLTSVSGVYFFRAFANKKSILDIPNERSSHVNPTPRGGGIVIAIIWFLAISFGFLSKAIDASLYLALICGIPVSAVGLIDDIIVISPKVRMFVQLVSASLAVFSLGGLSSVDVGFTQLSVPFVFDILSVIGIVWFTNLFNFLDGIDGYISAEIIFIGLAFFLLYGMVPPLLLATVTGGFLVWNWQPAKIFMGDAGSTLLGFSIGVFAIFYQNINQSSIIIWIILTSLFWFDATFTLLRRLRNHEKLSIAHKKHAYQRIVQAGFSHQKTVLYSLVINLGILGLVFISIKFPGLLLVALGADILYLYVVLRLVDKRFPFIMK
jgi:UDP-N-acetylmuramyl pentapeptide phosphotransferase/UDP-N-acetylglucosamine-1-phosphate transferase